MLQRSRQSISLNSLTLLKTFTKMTMKEFKLCLMHTQRHVVYKKACFHQRIQEQRENDESFIKALHALAENCAFGNSENIRDRLVIWLSDKNLSKQLHLKTTQIKPIHSYTESKAV